jgi:hypothetical protein
VLALSAGRLLVKLFSDGVTLLDKEDAKGAISHNAVVL